MQQKFFFKEKQNVVVVFTRWCCFRCKCKCLNNISIISWQIPNFLLLLLFTWFFFSYLHLFSINNIFCIYLKAKTIKNHDFFSANKGKCMDSDFKWNIKILVYFFKKNLIMGHCLKRGFLFSWKYLHSGLKYNIWKDLKVF